MHLQWCCSLLLVCLGKGFAFLVDMGWEGANSSASEFLLAVSWQQIGKHPVDRYLWPSPFFRAQFELDFTTESECRGDFTGGLIQAMQGRPTLPQMKIRQAF